MANKDKKRYEENTIDMAEFEDVFSSNELKSHKRTRRKPSVSDMKPTLMPDDLPKKNRRRFFAVPFGAIMFLLSFVGLITVVSFVAGVVQNITSSEKNMREYEVFLEPVVMYDPTPFDDITNADPEFLLESAIWSAVTVDAYPGKYDTDEAGKQIIPLEEVQNHYKRLFGTDTQPETISFSGYGFEVEYSQDLNAYLVPSTGVTPIYYPDVVKISKRGDSIILKVGYIPSGQMVESEEGVYKTPEPSKYMDITLRSKDGVRAISAIQLSDET